MPARFRSSPLGNATNFVKVTATLVIRKIIIILWL